MSLSGLIRLLLRKMYMLSFWSGKYSYDYKAVRGWMKGLPAMMTLIVDGILERS